MNDKPASERRMLRDQADPRTLYIRIQGARLRRVFIVGVAIALLQLLPPPARSQTCPNTGAPEATFRFEEIANIAPFPGSPPICNQNVPGSDPPLKFATPQIGGITYRTVGGCDPFTEYCSVEARAPVTVPGNHQNVSLNATFMVFWFGQEEPPSCNVPPCSPGAIEYCGLAFGGTKIVKDQGEAVIEVAANFNCNDPEAALEKTYSFRVIPCQGSTAPRSNSPPISIGAQLVEQLCQRRPPAPCNECTAAVGTGGASPGGGGGFCGASAPPAGAANGPHALLRHFSGGAGATGLPGSAQWRATLGRHWSHDYAERIVVDPDDTKVWLVTKEAAFIKFTGLSAGQYTQVAPTDEYRTLHRTTGWELHDLDGRVQIFDSSGRWVETNERGRNPVTAAYNAQGQLTSVLFPDGRSEVFEYYPTGQASVGKLKRITEVPVAGTGDAPLAWEYLWTGDDLVRVNRPDGTALLYAYGSPSYPGYLTRVTLLGVGGGERILIAREIDASGNVSKTWSGDTVSTSTSAVELYTLAFTDPLDPDDPLDTGTTIVTDPLGNMTTYSFDHEPGSLKSRLRAIVGDCPLCGVGPNTSFEYDDLGPHPMQPVATTDASGVRTEYEYNDFGQQSLRREAVGVSGQERQTEWLYGDPNFPTFVTRIRQPGLEPGTDRVTDLHYNAAGDLEVRTLQGYEETFTPPNFTLPTTFGYNPTSGSLEVSDPPGLDSSDQITTQYDDGTRGHLIPVTRTEPLVGTTTFEHDGFNRLTAVIDPNGTRTETEYDELDRVKKVTVCHVAAPETPCQGTGALVTMSTFNAFRDLERTTLPRGNVVEYGYDNAGRVNRIERMPAVAVPGERTLIDESNPRLRVETRQRWDGAWVTDSVVETAFLSRCQIEKVTQGKGSAAESVAEYDYDCEGRLTNVWDANHPFSGGPSTSTQYQYDALDRLETVSQPRGGGGPPLVTNYAYDAQDHLVGVTDSEGNVTSYEYSDRDLLIREVSPASGITVHRYDEHANRISTTDARGIEVQRSYDALDRLISVTYPDATLDTVYTYDQGVFALGRLSNISTPVVQTPYAYDEFGRVVQDGVLVYQYDANSNRTVIDYPGFGAAVYGYDFADREASLSFVGGSTVPVVTSANYKASGPLAEVTFANGMKEIRGFDPRYHPASIQVPGRFEWTYSTDGVGNVLEITDALHPLGSRSFAYQDHQYFLTRADGPWGSLDWTYDRIANRMTETRNGEQETYQYISNGAGNRPLLDFVVQAPSIGGIRDYSYGPAGHLEQVAPGANSVSLAYDDAGRLRQMSRIGGETAQAVYDGRGYLAQVGSEERFLTDGIYDSQGVVHRIGFEQCPNCNPQPSFFPEYVLYFAGRPIALAGFSIKYLTTDHLGTPILATAATGANPAACNLDLDGSGVAEPGDGLVLERYLLGYRGDALIADGLDAIACSRCTPAAIEPYVASCLASYDVDGNTKVDGFTDGILARRRLADFGGASLIQLAVAADCVRCTSSQISSYLNTLVPAAQLWSGGFEPFGKDFTNASAKGIFLRLPGQWVHSVWGDASLGGELYYNVNRWYENQTARYVAPDPASLSGLLGPSQNQYFYANQNPLIFADPLGLYTVHGDGRFKREIEGAIEQIRKDLANDKGGCCAQYFAADGVDIQQWLQPGGPPHIVQSTQSVREGVCGWAQKGPPFSYLFVNWDCFRTPNPCRLASLVLHETGHLARHDTTDNEPALFFELCNFGCTNPGRFQ